MQRFSKEQIAKVANELHRWQQDRLDILVPLEAVRMDKGGAMHLDIPQRLLRVENRTFVGTDYKRAEEYLDTILEASPDKRGKIAIEPFDTKERSFELTNKAKSQFVHGRLEIPAVFVRRQSAKNNVDLVWEFINGALKRDKRTVLLRILDGQVRAVMSDSYQPLDSHALFFAAANAIKEAGGEMWEARLFDDGFQLTGVNMGVHERLVDYLENKPEHTIARGDHPGGDGGAGSDAGVDRDPLNESHYGMMSLSNDEAGGGSCNLDFGVLRGACLNGLLLTDHILQIRHSGGKLGSVADGGFVLSAATQLKMMDAELSKISDAATSAFDPERLKDVVRKLAKAKGDVIPEGRAAAAVKAVCSSFDIPKDKHESMLSELLSSRDTTRFGLIQAATHQAHSMSESGDSAAAAHVEQVGGKLLEVQDFEKFIDAGEKAFDNPSRKEEDVFAMA
jgi:hypothetical protein